MPVKAKRWSHAKRIMASYLVVEAEELTKTSTELGSALSKHFLVKVDGSTLSGNIAVIFDVNGFGEALTAPRVRKPPLTKGAVPKLFEAVSIARRGNNNLKALGPGEVFIVLNGGRTNNTFASKLFGVGPGVGRSKAKGSAISWREITVTFTPESVMQRRVRTSRSALAALKCSQKMFWWFDANVTEIPVKAHKHVPGLQVPIA